ncbi:hypothetical protein GQ457_08G025420 [Hibiscus cannabinus]
MFLFVVSGAPVCSPLRTRPEPYISLSPSSASNHRRLAGLLGLKDQENDPHNNNQTPHNRTVLQETGLPRRGFSVSVQVAAARPQPGPVLLPCNSCDGGIQGLKWYARRLKMDEDGDVADEFLDEVLPETLGSADVENEQKPLPKFQVKYNTRPANAKTLLM